MTYLPAGFETEANLRQRCMYIFYLLLYLELQPVTDGLSFNKASALIYSGAWASYIWSMNPDS